MTDSGNEEDSAPWNWWYYVREKKKRLRSNEQFFVNKFTDAIVNYIKKVWTWRLKGSSIDTALILSISFNFNLLNIKLGRMRQLPAGALEWKHFPRRKFYLVCINYNRHSLLQCSKCFIISMIFFVFHIIS